MPDTLAATLTDYDPTNELPIQPHGWGVRLEFPPVGNEAGGAWGFDAPNQLWAEIIKQAVDNLTEEQWLVIKANGFQH
jgi:hypothetical protein